MNTTKNRLKIVRKKRRMTLQAFADALGVSRSTVESYEYGKRQPSTAYINYVCERFNVSRDWLTTGFGDMDAGESREMYALDALKKARPDMPDSFAAHVAEALDKLDADDWMFLAKLAQDMAKKAKEAQKTAPDESKADNEMVYSETVAKNEQRTPFAVRKGHDTELLEEAKTRVKKVPGSDLE